MLRLCNESLKHLSKVEQARYSRSDCIAGIVHLGVGAFHRAHQAFYTEQVLNQSSGPWGIIGASLRSAKVSEDMAEQDCLYTLLTKGQEESAQVIGAIRQVIVAPQDPEALIGAMSAENIKIISLTITEKGYCHQPASGRLDLDNPAIKHDLENLDQPQSALGFIIAALLRRQEQNLSVSILSCDNLPNNGKTTKDLVLELAKLVDTELANWIESNVSFPSSMVDRITPATQDKDLANFANRWGYHDKALILTEPFTQWVIEDDFIAGRPDWQNAGALLVEDVEPYENLKLRLLNGCHSMLAYCGSLAGYQTIAEVMQDKRFKKLALHFMRLAATSLAPPQGFDVDAYINELIQRFENPGLAHLTRQIAMDGSQKIPQRWLASLSDLQSDAKPKDLDIYYFCLAAWMYYLSAQGDSEGLHRGSDPLAEDIALLAQNNWQDSDKYCRSVVNLKQVFPPQLAENKALITAVSSFLKQFKDNGFEQALVELAD